MPWECSTGRTVRRGGITKTGDSHARRVLVEGAWAYRMKPRVGRHKVDQIEALPKPVREIGAVHGAGGGTMPGSPRLHYQPVMLAL